MKNIKAKVEKILNEFLVTNTIYFRAKYDNAINKYKAISIIQTEKDKYYIKACIFNSLEISVDVIKFENILEEDKVKFTKII